MQSKSFILLNSVSKSADFQSDDVDIGFINGFNVNVIITNASNLDLNVYLEGSATESGDNFAEISGTRNFISGDTIAGWNVSDSYYRRFRVGFIFGSGSATIEIECTIKAI